jgi:hypothetical protein
MILAFFYCGAVKMCHENAKTIRVFAKAKTRMVQLRISEML